VSDVDQSTDRDYYVTVADMPSNDGTVAKHGFLLGPYATHVEALAQVERGRQLALAANDRAWWYAYGTASLPRGTAVRVVFPVVTGAEEPAGAPAEPAGSPSTLGSGDGASTRRRRTRS
jgi:hypothetical protein